MVFGRYVFREKRCGCLCILNMPIHACILCLIMNNDAYDVNKDERKKKLYIYEVAKTFMMLGYCTWLPGRCYAGITIEVRERS